MKSDLLEIYTDYLLVQNYLATATGLSNLLQGQVSHDQITRFLHSGDFGSKELWKYVKPYVRKYEMPDGVLIVDDAIEEKPHTDENDVICWHYSHAKGSLVKGINILSALAHYEQANFPIGYEVVRKTIAFCDLQTRRVRRKSKKTKNELFQDLIRQAMDNDVSFSYILADNWFGAKNNMQFIHEKLKKSFVFGIKSNRMIALSLRNKQQKQFIKLRFLEIEDGQSCQIWLKGVDFPLQLLKKVFKNENGSIGVLYLVTNDLKLSADKLYSIYQKRWKIEEFHKSIKQNASLAKSPTKTVKSQCNHVFSSMVAFCKLELLKFKTALNHFAIRYKLLIKANQAAWKELKNMQNITSSA